MKTTTQSQFGRSMLEILGVLAVVGVLTMAGISGYQYALQKQRANTVVHEAHLARVDALGIDGERRNWEVVRFHPKSGYVMLSSKDEDGDIFVRIEQVEQQICRLMVPLGGHNKMRFFRALNIEETEWEEIFVCPNEPIDIIVSFNNGSIPGKNCTMHEECQNAHGGYCDMEKQICAQCPEDTELNPSKTVCNPICDMEEETNCWLDEVRWCCPNTQICGQNPNECVESDGFCEYRLDQSEISVSAECIYEVLPTDDTRQADCWYTIPTLTEGSILTLQEGKGCNQNRYCLLKSENNNCTGNIDKAKTGVVYGTCVEKSESSSECGIKNPDTPAMREIKGCLNNRYCLLKYKDMSCGTEVPKDHVGKIYGTCAEKSESSATCSPNITTIEGIMSPIIPCPQTQYCYLNYSSKGCTNTVGSKGSNPFYGLCLDKDTNKLVCPTTK